MWSVKEVAESGEALEQAAQRGAGGTIPGSFQERGRYHSEWHGLEQSQAWVDSWTEMISVIFPTFMIL